MQTEILVVGGGIVGLATAMELRRQGRDVLVLEEEKEIACHQTGHNSGVIHSGLYYKPGSEKAKNCVAGRELMYDFCKENGIRHERCGKLVVATTEEELKSLENLRLRGEANGIKIEQMDEKQIKEVEPHVAGLGGLWVRDTGIVNYKEVCKVYAEKIGLNSILTRASCFGADFKYGGVTAYTSEGVIFAKTLVNCAGLYSDVLARGCNVDPVVKIVPFRGEYYDLRPQARYLVKNLIYPVPDARLPFLGVHFTRMIGGGVECGPNAVLALSRKGYSWKDISIEDNLELLGFKGFWKMARNFWRVGISEVLRSFSKRRFYNSLKNLIPSLEYDDIVRSGSGVRAQAVLPSGKLVDDFYIVRSEGMVHVLNAPSPAATASISIGKTIAAMV